MSRRQRYLDVWNDASTLLIVTSDRSVWEPLLEADLSGDCAAGVELDGLHRLQDKAQGALYALGQLGVPS